MHLGTWPLLDGQGALQGPCTNSAIPEAEEGFYIVCQCNFVAAVIIDQITWHKGCSKAGTGTL